MEAKAATGTADTVSLAIRVIAGITSPVMRTPSPKGPIMKINVDLTPLKRAWQENPIAVLGTSALALGAGAKLIDALSAAQGRRAYAKQVNNSVKKSKR